MSDNPGSIDPRIVEQHGDETSIRLRAGGWDKWVDGLIQLMKLFVWAFVEVVLASQLLAAIGWRTPAAFDKLIETHPPAWAELLILLFIAGWTAAGVSAIFSLLRELFGSDLIVLTTSEIRVSRRVGPFGRERVFTPGSIDWVAIKGQTRLLFISVASKEIVIASLGTWPDRRFVAETLEKRYGLKTPSEKAQGAAPAGWSADRSADGFVQLRNRSHDRSLIGCAGAISVSCWIVALYGIAIRLIEDSSVLNLTIGDVLRPAVAVISTIIVFWAARASRFIRARRNEVLIETRFGPGSVTERLPTPRFKYLLRRRPRVLRTYSHSKR